jgi:hypothetical protein
MRAFPLSTLSERKKAAPGSRVAGASLVPGVTELKDSLSPL